MTDPIPTPAPQAPDTFAQARANAPEGRHPVLPNRANGAGGSEAAGDAPNASPERAEGLEDLTEQGLDEGLELTFPASDPINPTGGVTRIDPSGAEVSASREAEAAEEASKATQAAKGDKGDKKGKSKS